MIKDQIKTEMKAAIKEIKALEKWIYDPMITISEFMSKEHKDKKARLLVLNKKMEILKAEFKNLKAPKCAYCDNQPINYKHQSSDQGLCDDCFDELSIDPYTDIIGYRKGE